MTCPYSPEKHQNGIVCTHYKNDSLTCTDPIDQSFCGTYKRMAGVRHE